MSRLAILCGVISLATIAAAKTQGEVEACISKNRLECYNQCKDKIPAGIVPAVAQAIFGCFQADARPAIKACLDSVGITADKDCVQDKKHNGHDSHSKSQSKEDKYKEARGKMKDFLTCKQSCKAKQGRCDTGCGKIPADVRKNLLSCFVTARETRNAIKDSQWTCVNQGLGLKSS